MTNEEYGLSLQVCGLIPESTDDYLYDSSYADVTASNLWQRWYEMYIQGKYPPGTMWLCGVALVPYATDLELARKAADDRDVEYDETDTAVEICNAIVAADEEE